MASRFLMPRLPQPTATRIPGLMRLAVLEESHCRRTSAATSATRGCGAVWRTSWTCGMSTGNPRLRSWHRHSSRRGTKTSTARNAGATINSLRRDLQGELLALPEPDPFNRCAAFLGAYGGHVPAAVLHRLTRDLDDHVAVLEPALLGRAAGADAVHEHAAVLALVVARPHAQPR